MAAVPFSDSDSTRWVAGVDYGDNSGTQAASLAGSTLAPVGYGGGGTFLLDHQYPVYNTNGNNTYYGNVYITDGGGTQSPAIPFTVTITDSQAQVGLDPVAPVTLGSSTTLTGSFVDNDSGSWTAKANWNYNGDGDQNFQSSDWQTISINPTLAQHWDGSYGTSSSPNTFSASNPYQYPGVYTVAVEVSDEAGVWGLQTQQVTVSPTITVDSHPDCQSLDVGGDGENGNPNRVIYFSNDQDPAVQQACWVKMNVQIPILAPTPTIWGCDI